MKIMWVITVKVTRVCVNFRFVRKYIYIILIAVRLVVCFGEPAKIFSIYLVLDRAAEC